MIIGVTGTIGAGKGTLVEYLKERHGFAHYSVRDFIVEEIRKRGLPENRDSMTTVANDIRRKHGSGYIVEKLFERADANKAIAAIESIRTLGEIDAMRQKGDCCIFAVDADVKVRYKRILARNQSTDHISFEKFLSDEEREMQSDDLHKQNLKACMSAADFIFQNNGDKKEFYRKVDEIMEKIIKS